MTQCRNCNYDLVDFMTFGRMPIANAFIERKNFNNEYFFELTPTYCEKCTLFQLKYQPEPIKLFHENYAFFANTSKYMQSHFESLTKKIIDKFNINKNDLIVEIGNNDGGMVKYFKDRGFKHLGVDPSKNVSDFAKSLGVEVFNDFFNLRNAKLIRKDYGSAKVFLSANTLAHIQDINSVFEGIEYLLDDEGIFITEDPYLLDVFNKISYDQIYDEHVFIFSLNSMQNLCSQYNLEVFDVEPLNTAGGSLRYYICRKGKKSISLNAKNTQANEKKINLYDNSIYSKFKENCEKSKDDLVLMLNNLINRGKKIACYGATSKTTTIFNYCDIDQKQISYITDTSLTKQGKFSPGKHIPIHDYDYFLDNLPDFCFLGAWNHTAEIFNKEKNNFSIKGKWITHIPNVSVV